ncbi:MAG: DUF3037 domain-containing protein [Kiritimatiellae bacterium]|nr:DUF3037 domain-containing protein [Kiritimatiellia bacterium]MBP5227118.1 DUF3037 domain-containing protein [Kiritimatiellia bacterium]
MPEIYHCAVVPVSLRPSPLSQENACFGVIVKCDATGFLDYKLAQYDEKVISRITTFFPDYGRENLMRVMEWAAHDIGFTIQKEREKNVGAFGNLIRPRENVIRYGNPFVVATSDPAHELCRQYDSLVAVPDTVCKDVTDGAETGTRP